MQRLNEMRKMDRTRLPALRGIESEKLRKAIKKLDVLLGKIKVDDVTDVDDLIYCASAVVVEDLGVKREGGKKSKEPWWKRRLEGHVKHLNRDLGRINTIIEKKSVKEKYKDELERKYKIRRRGLQVVKEEIRQKIKAKTGKITRYQQRVSQYKQNRLFRNNERRFYQQLNNESEHLENEVPDAETARNFWSDIWSREVQHNKNANWLHECRNEVENTSVQESIDITDEKVKDILKRMPNWKAPGPDGVQGFWLKNFTSMHKYIRLYLIDCLENGTPTWMTREGRYLYRKIKIKEEMQVIIDLLHVCP